MTKTALAAATAALILAGAGMARADSLPKAIGQCTATTIAKLGSRLDGAPDSGSAVEYANGGYQVSYDTEKGLLHSRVGDKVKLCLVMLPKDCPPGDERGKTYKATNLRTHATWVLPDSEHMCGGA